MTETFRPDYLLPGTDIAGYTLQQLLGAGSSGAVYEVRSREGNPFAMKVSKFRPGEPSSVASLMDGRFTRSIYCLEALRGVKNVAQLYAHDRYPDPLSGWQFYVQELVPGSETLIDWARRTSPTLRELAHVFQQLALTCGELAHAEIRHRDLKPSNILMGAGGVPKVIDFGSAICFRAEELTGPLPSEVPGTMSYFSPELCAAILKERAGKQVGTFTYLPMGDLHALGVIFYQVFTGKHPFVVPGQTEDDLLRRIAEQVPARPRALNPNVPFVLDEAVMHLLAKSPSVRCQNGDDLLDILKRAERNVGDASWDVPFRVGAPAVPAPVVVQVPVSVPTLREGGHESPPLAQPRRPAAWFAAGAAAFIVAGGVALCIQPNTDGASELPQFEPEVIARVDYDSDVSGVPSRKEGVASEAMTGGTDAATLTSELVLRATLITGPLTGQKLAPCNKNKSELKYKGACWRLLYHQGSCELKDLYEPEVGYCKKWHAIYEPVYVEQKAKKPGSVVEPATPDVPIIQDRQP